MIPGYRPAFRLSWRAMLLTLLMGGGLLMLSAVGTRWTVAAILSPQERMERIEKKMAEYADPEPADSDPDRPGANPPKARVSGRVLIADGSPLPPARWVNIYHKRRRSSGAASVRMGADGKFSTEGFKLNPNVAAGTYLLERGSDSVPLRTLNCN